MEAYLASAQGQGDWSGAADDAAALRICVRMNITLKLFATLTDYLPAESRYTNIVELDVRPDAPSARSSSNTACRPNGCIWCWSMANTSRLKTA